MASGFPYGFVGPLPFDAYYVPALSRAEYSAVASGPSFTTSPMRDNSNYDVISLLKALSAPSPFVLPSGTVTYTTNVGQFEELIADANGVTPSYNSSVTVTGDEGYVQEQIDDVLLILPPSYSGQITITETRTGPSPLTRDIPVLVTPYDDGSYEATLQSLKTVGVSLSTSSVATTPVATSPVATTQPVISPAVAPTGIRGGIDWNTLVFVRHDGAMSTDPGTGKQYATTGNIWHVSTTAGTVLEILEADPLSQQPAATRAIPSYTDPSYNCHGYTVGATNVVCPDGVTRSFEIVNSDDAKAILSAAYTKVTVDQAFAAAGTKNLYFVFSDQGGNVVHSAVNTPPQTFSRSTFFGFTTGLGGSTVVSSKNGDQNLQGNITIALLLAIYPKNSITIYVANS